MSSTTFQGTATGISEDFQKTKISDWHHDDQLKKPTGSFGGDDDIFRNPKKSLSSLTFKPGNDIVRVENTSNIKQNVFEGQIEKIFDTYVLVVFDINDCFIERKISLERLSSIDADFEGANVRLSITEKNDGTIISKIEKGSDEPYDARPDEDFIHTLNSLKKHLS